MPWKIGVWVFMFSSSCNKLRCSARSNQKNQAGFGESLLDNKKTPQEAQVISRIALRKCSFATVGQLLVCPPSPALFAAGTVFGACPFLRTCPARHWRRVLLAKRYLYLWFAHTVVHFHSFVKGKLDFYCILRKFVYLLQKWRGSGPPFL